MKFSKLFSSVFVISDMSGYAVVLVLLLALRLPPSNYRMVSGMMRAEETSERRRSLENLVCFFYSHRSIISRIYSM